MSDPIKPCQNLFRSHAKCLTTSHESCPVTIDRVSILQVRV